MRGHQRRDGTKLQQLVGNTNSSVKQCVNAEVQAGISQIDKQYDQANTISTSDLKAQVDDLKVMVTQLCSQIGTLSSNIGTGDNKNKNLNTRNQHGNHRTTQYGSAEDNITWTTYILFSNDWSRKKKDNYKIEYKRNEPEGYKMWMKACIHTVHDRQLKQYK